MKRALVVAMMTSALLGATACTPRKKVSLETLELGETYKAQSGLAVVHHPKEMVPSQINEYVVALRPIPFGPFDKHDDIYVATNKVTATSVLDEYVRMMHQPFETDVKGWTETSRKASQCLGVYPGMEIEATFIGDDGERRRYWSCTFLTRPHGYKLSYAVADSAAKTEAPLLRKILDATEVTPQAKWE